MTETLSPQVLTPVAPHVSGEPPTNGAGTSAAAEIDSWLTDLERDVKAHPGVNHMLLSRVATGRYTKTDFLTFGLQHNALVGFFTKYMELLLLGAPDSNQKLWLAKVLVNEYGEGSDGKDHTELYTEYLYSAGARDKQWTETDLCMEVWGFVGEHLRICREEPFLVGLGALGPGHEWAIPKMFHHIIPGLRRAGLPEEGIQYFTLHCEQDIDHGAWMTEALRDMVKTPEARAQVRRGALLSLTARYKFWTGVERQIVTWRQPVSIEAVRKGLHAPDLKPVDTRSPGRLGDLQRAVDAFLVGKPWPIALPASTTDLK